MTLVWFIILNFSAFLVASSIAKLVTRDGGTVEGYLLTIGLFPIVAVLVVLAFGIPGFLNVGVIAPTIVAMAVVVSFVAHKRTPDLETSAVARSWFSQLKDNADDPWCHIAAAFLAAFGTVYLIRGLLDGVEFHYDDLAYHATAPAYWLTQGRITLPLNGYIAYYPYNAELFSLWFMLPFGSDSYAGLAGVLWTGSTLAGALAIFALLNVRHSAALLACAGFLASRCLVPAFDGLDRV